MPQQRGNIRLSPDQTNYLLDCYMQYRFREGFSTNELAKKAGVKPEIVQKIVQRQPVDGADLKRVANCLGVSEKLLCEICGIDEISSEMLETLNRFMGKTLPGTKTREAGKR